MKRVSRFYCTCGCGRRLLLPSPPKAQQVRLARMRRSFAEQLKAHAAAIVAAHAQQADRLPGDERPDQPAPAAPILH